MTINSTNRKAGPFSGDGATTAFPFSFKVFSAADVYVVQADITGAETVKTLTTDYTVSLNPDQNANPGGTVTILVPPPVGYKLTLSSLLPYLQQTDLTNQGGFYPKVITDALDRLTIFVQQLAESVNRSLKTSITTPPGVNPTLPTPVPYQLIGWNKDGTGLQNTDPTYSTALATDLANSADSAKGASLIGYAAKTLAQLFKSQVNAVLSSITNLRALDKTKYNQACVTGYYAAGDGGGGVYFYDSTDTTSADNGGTIIVAADGARWKLSTTAIISVKQFGAVGDGSHDDTTAIQAAINAATTNTTIAFPPGFYVISAAINLPNTYSLTLVGAGYYSTRIYCNSAGNIQSMFNTTNGQIYDTWRITGIGFLGNNKAGSAFRCENLIHSQIDHCLIINTTTTAIRANNGYNNTLEDNIIYNNADGIDASGAAINNVNILKNQIYANSGYGIKVANGLNVNIIGNGIEQNAKAGITAYDIKALRINGNYFERNGGTGVAYTTPESVTIKSDIHILSAGLATLGYTSTTTVDSCEIEGNHFTPYGQGNIPSAGLSIDAPVFACVADKLRVQNNQVFDTTKISFMVALYNYNTYSNISSLVVEQNSVNSCGFVGTGNTNLALNTAHNILDRSRLQAANFASQNLNDWAIQAGTTGSLIRSAQNFQGYHAWDITAGDKIYGPTVSLTAFPELKGKYVWFGGYYRVQDAGAGLQLRINAGGTTSFDSNTGATEGVTAAGAWNFKSVCKLIGASDTSITPMISRVGSGSNPVVFAFPILAVFGDGTSRFPIPNGPVTMYSNAAPTVGTWAKGDRIINVNPAVGSAKAWTCTVAGAPGTWVSEGNL